MEVGEWGGVVFDPTRFDLRAERPGMTLLSQFTGDYNLRIRVIYMRELTVRALAETSKYPHNKFIVIIYRAEGNILGK